MSAMNVLMHSRNAEKCAGVTSTILLCTLDIFTPISLNFTLQMSFCVYIHSSAKIVAD